MSSVGDVCALAPVVVKVGGSLLAWVELPERLRTFLTQFSGRPCLIIAGGGAAADVVRTWDARHQLPISISHALAVQSMSLTARLIAVVSGLEVVFSISQAVERWHGGAPVVPLVLDAQADVLSATGDALPASWDVTSDAISAWIALRLPAADLVFLKSVDVPLTGGLQAAVGAGSLDSYTPRLLSQAQTPLRTGWVNLRNDLPALQWITEFPPLATTVPTAESTVETRAHDG